MLVLRCEDSTDGILSAVYDAWEARAGHSNTKIELISDEYCYNEELFAEYRTVSVDYTKAQKVLASVKSKISERAAILIVRASLSGCEDKADCIYHFLVRGFHFGSRVIDYLSDYYVRRIFEMDRYVGNDTHFYLGFLRFKEIDRGRLCACYEPNNDITTLLMPHFSDRFSSENFIIADTKRKLAGIHPAMQEWFVMQLSDEENTRFIKISEKKEDYEDLWRCFFDTIAIEERKNNKLQRQNCALHYRKYMTEFMT